MLRGGVGSADTRADPSRDAGLCEGLLVSVCVLKTHSSHHERCGRSDT